MGIYPKGMMSAHKRDTSMPIFIAVLFTTASVESGQVSIKRQMDEENVVYIYTVECYLAIKKNKILSCTSKWMKLEDITLNKISQI